LRCDAEIEFVGLKKFHEGKRLDALGVFGSLAVNQEELELYVCPGCGHVELFAPGAGDRRR